MTGLGYTSNFFGNGDTVSEEEFSRRLASLPPRTPEKLNVYLVQRRTEAQWRIYRLNPDALREVDRWMEKYRVFWAARMHDLKRYVEESP